MCQLNLYLVPKSVPEEEVINSIEKHVKGIAESKYIIDALANSYNFYCGYGCDCHSYVSRLQDEEAGSFDEFKAKKKDEDIKKLARMKSLKESEDYQQRIDKFNYEKDAVWARVESFTSPIEAYRDEQIEMLTSLNLQEKEELEQLYLIAAKEKEMFDEVESIKEYQAAYKVYQDYMKANADLRESARYDIEENEKLVAEYDFGDYYEEFKNLRNIFAEVLKIADEICLYPFWMDEGPMEIKGERQVDIEDLKIDDLVFLPYKNLLKINRGR